MKTIAKKSNQSPAPLLRKYHHFHFDMISTVKCLYMKIGTNLTLISYTFRWYKRNKISQKSIPQGYLQGEYSQFQLAHDCPIEKHIYKVWFVSIHNVVHFQWRRFPKTTMFMENGTEITITVAPSGDFSRDMLSTSKIMYLKFDEAQCLTPYTFWCHKKPDTQPTDRYLEKMF